jgi:anti-sigma-K factor RskA
MVKMKNAQEAQAFAITLEPKGGSSAPTGGMYLMGKL